MIDLVIDIDINILSININFNKLNISDDELNELSEETKYTHLRKCLRKEMNSGR